MAATSDQKESEHELDTGVLANTALGAVAGGLGAFAALGTLLLPIAGTAMAGAVIAYLLSPEHRKKRPGSKSPEKPADDS